MTHCCLCGAWYSAWHETGARSMSDQRADSTAETSASYIPSHPGLRELHGCCSSHCFTLEGTFQLPIAGSSNLKSLGLTWRGVDTHRPTGVTPASAGFLGLATLSACPRTTGPARLLRSRPESLTSPPGWAAPALAPTVAVHVPVTL